MFFYCKRIVHMIYNDHTCTLALWHGAPKECIVRATVTSFHVVNHSSTLRPLPLKSIDGYGVQVRIDDSYMWTAFIRLKFLKPDG